MKTIAVLAVGFAVAVTGCGSTNPAPPPVKPASSPTSAVAVSPRGNAIKKPGETAYWDMKDGSGSLTFVIDHFALTSGCPGGRAPEHGANLVFDLQVSTPASWPADAGNVFHRDGYTVVGPDGVTVRDAWQGNTTSCDDYDAQWADSLAAGSKYQGKVVLDVPPGSTVLAFNPTQISVRGFEWALPAMTPAAEAPKPSTAAAPVESPQERDRRIRQELIALGCSTSGCIQTWFACRDDQQTGPACEFYRQHPVN